MTLAQEFKAMQSSRVHEASLSTGSFIRIETRISVDSEQFARWRLRMLRCAWRIGTTDETIAGSEDDASVIENGLERINGVVIESAEINETTYDVNIRFDNGIYLQLFPDTTRNSEHWRLYRPDGSVIIAGPGKNWRTEIPNSLPASSLEVLQSEPISTGVMFQLAGNFDPEFILSYLNLDSSNNWLVRHHIHPKRHGDQAESATLTISSKHSDEVDIAVQMADLLTLLQSQRADISSLFKQNDGMITITIELYGISSINTMLTQNMLKIINDLGLVLELDVGYY